MTDFDMLAVPTRWTLEDALTVIRPLQAGAKQFHYHLCLGGGVLNKGWSEKDLDLYFMPLNNKHLAAADELIKWLSGMWGEPEVIGGRGYRTEPPYTHLLQFKYGEQRIDVFVLGSEQAGTIVREADEQAEEVQQDTNWTELMRGGGGGGGIAPTTRPIHPGEWGNMPTTTAWTLRDYY